MKTTRLDMEGMESAQQTVKPVRSEFISGA